VDVNYTGSGTVDASHKIYIALWDSADFNAVPTAVKPLESKTGTVTFTDVQKSPVYVSAAFDPTGKWDAPVSTPCRVIARHVCHEAADARSDQRGATARVPAVVSFGTLGIIRKSSAS